MKSILAVLLTSSYVFAGQSIICRQITKSGQFKANGGGVKLNLEFNRDGSLNAKQSSVKLSNFTKRDVVFKTYVIGSNVSKESAPNEYTTLFISDDHGIYDIQLQFDSRIFNKSFRNNKASFVVGSEDSNPETGFSFGIDVSCNSRLN